ncbi:AAA-like domain-containing protein [candidate division KSB1 bacterium]|nr:AAA-like domain-containing protein [candidate division KSB1 bacterium]
MSKSKKKAPVREFNITGKILSDRHYYVDLTPQLEKLTVLVEKGRYFVINRPRQFGKTTTLDFLAQLLLQSKFYLPVFISFEGFGSVVNEPLHKFYALFWDNVIAYLKLVKRTLKWKPNNNAAASDPTFGFKDNVGRFCKAAGRKKIVLLVDEADGIPETFIIEFLHALREMYLARDLQPTFHAVALAGVHDIKNLKMRVRDESKSVGSYSPFNIAIDYVIPAFTRENIRDYYAQHTAETGQVFDEKVITRVHELTSGHPWLVSALAKRLVEEIVPDRAITIETKHVDEAVQLLLKEHNTNFDSLIKHAHEPELQPIVLDLLQGKYYPFTPFDPVLNRLALYGVIRAGEGNGCTIGNPIYAQVLLASFHRVMAAQMINGDVKAGVIDADGRLDFRRVLDKFQAFMKTKGPEIVRSHEFKEATGQLLLLSYLDLLVNGKGWTFKDVQSGDGRIDVICCYKTQKEIVELKLWYGEQRYEQGLEQLLGYLESESLSQGYLVVFDRREAAKEYTFAEHEVNGKKILAWVV